MLIKDFHKHSHFPNKGFSKLFIVLLTTYALAACGAQKSSTVDLFGTSPTSALAVDTQTTPAQAAPAATLSTGGEIAVSTGGEVAVSAPAVIDSDNPSIMRLIRANISDGRMGEIDPMEGTSADSLTGVWYGVQTATNEKQTSFVDANNAPVDLSAAVAAASLEIQNLFSNSRNTNAVSSSISELSLRLMEDPNDPTRIYASDCKLPSAEEGVLLQRTGDQLLMPILGERSYSLGTLEEPISMTTIVDNRKLVQSESYRLLGGTTPLDEYLSLQVSPEAKASFVLPAGMQNISVDTQFVQSKYVTYIKLNDQYDKLLGRAELMGVEPMEVACFASMLNNYNGVRGDESERYYSYSVGGTEAKNLWEFFDQKYSKATTEAFYDGSAALITKPVADVDPLIKQQIDELQVSADLSFEQVLVACEGLVESECDNAISIFDAAAKKLTDVLDAQGIKYIDGDRVVLESAYTVVDTKPTKLTDDKKMIFEKFEVLLQGHQIDFVVEGLDDVRKGSVKLTF